jgi:hypothetical protein
MLQKHDKMSICQNIGLHRLLANQSGDTPPAAFVWLLQLSDETIERMGNSCIQIA